jgi:CubicO group peptidase (beta-lactamase class C family)
MSELQERIQRHIDRLVGTGAETGVQVAVYQDGRPIVDAVAGTADPDTGRPLTSGTPIFSFSTAKNMTATLAHLLVARASSTTTARSRTCGPSSVRTARPPRHCGTC